MNSTHFTKLCSDAHLMNKTTVRKAELDIVYHRCRAHAEALEVKQRPGVFATARMFYPQFLIALQVGGGGHVRMFTCSSS